MMKTLLKVGERMNEIRKTVAITGSTGGLGREICSALAARGENLILLDRNTERSEMHKSELLQKQPGVNVTCIECDLEDIESVERATELLIKRGIDVFIHNAGAYKIPRRKCSTGYDNVFQINFASPYYMIKRLMPTLKERRGRVVAVGSIAHNYSRINENDIEFLNVSACSKVYGNAKRYLMFSLWELFKDDKDVKLAITHPGITFTNITAHYPPLIFAIIKHPMKVIFMKPKKAALSIVEGVYSNCGYLEWLGPRFLDVWGLPKKKKVKTASKEERIKIAEIAERVYLNTCKFKEN